MAKRNTLLLARLMGKTGIVVERLEPSIAETLVIRVVELVQTGEFIEMLLSWLIAAVDRKVALSAGCRNAISECLAWVCSNVEQGKVRLDEVQLSEANRVFNMLHTGLNPVH